MLMVLPSQDMREGEGLRQMLCLSSRDTSWRAEVPRRADILVDQRQWEGEGVAVARKCKNRQTGLSNCSLAWLRELRKGYLVVNKRIVLSHSVVSSSL